jgi:hypothetical protein
MLCTSTSKRAKCAEKNEEALKLLSQLQSKHGSMYSLEQYHAWAQLIGIKKHKSLLFLKGKNQGIQQPVLLPPTHLTL